MAIADKLNELITLKDDLAYNLDIMGVSASTSETLTTLVPKVLEIESTPSITKGVIVKSQTSDGFANEVEIVGLTKIPSYYMQSESTTAPSFWGKMTKLKIPDYITEVGQYAFSFDQYYELLNGELPDSITSVGQYGFYYNDNLKITKLPSELTTTGTSSFSHCINMTINELPSSLKTIGNSCFHTCPNVKIKEIPSTVTTLGQASFYSGTGITGTLVVNASITVIATNTFNGCSNMTTCELTQPNLTKIDAYAFSKCSKLTKLIIRSTTLPSLPNSNAFNNTPIASGTGYVYFEDDLVASAKTATNWSKYASQIKPKSELEG